MIKYLLPLVLVASAYAEPALMLCHGKYALCAASSTTPTGKTIVINGVTFQEGVSVCPVLTGKSIGDRNLIGSCKPPKGQNTVWSLFSTATEYPQAPSWAVVIAQPRTFITTEALGVSFCQLLFGLDTMWKQTSYNGNIRKNYAGIGFTFDAVRNAFIAPKPEGDGWTFDEDLCTWRNLELEEAQKNVQIGITRV